MYCLACDCSIDEVPDEEFQLCIDLGQTSDDCPCFALDSSVPLYPEQPPRLAAQINPVFDALFV